MKTIRLGPWKKGINNNADGHVLPEGACRDALNVDLTEDGRCVTRTGYSQTVAADRAHSLSLQGDKVLLGLADTLNVVTAVNPLTVTEIRSSLDVLPISYAERGGEVWWSNGTQSGRISTSNTDHPWVPSAPGDIVSISPGVGVLPPGAYRVAITHAMADGEESVTSDIYSYTLAVTGALVVILPAAAVGAVYFNVYCTLANSATLQKYSTVVAATGSVTISTPPTGRQLRNRAFLSPLPAGDAICFHGNRLLSLKGEFLYYSEPWDYGVYDPQANFIALGANGSIIASVEDGVFVAADRTWFYAGDDIKIAAPVEVQSCGAISGTVFEHPDMARARGWYSEEGLVVGAPDGSIKRMQKDLGFTAPVAETGSVWIKERDGQSFAIVSLDSTASYGRQVSPDFTRARYRYNDDSTTMSINLATGATARYAEWHMNSYATIGDEEYGCNDIGMHLLEGENDAGTDIVAVVDCGLVGAASSQLKSPVSIYTVSKSSAPLVVTIELADQTSLDFPARTYSSDMFRMNRHDGLRGLMNVRQAWFDTVIRNDAGSTFDFTTITIIMSESARKV